MSDKEKLVGQQDIHVSKKTTNIEKYGAVKELKHALSGATHVRTVQLTTKDISAAGLRSIFMHGYAQLIRLYKIPVVTS